MHDGTTPSPIAGLAAAEAASPDMLGMGAAPSPTMALFTHSHGAAVEEASTAMGLGGSNSGQHFSLLDEDDDDLLQPPVAAAAGATLQTPTDEAGATGSPRVHGAKHRSPTRHEAVRASIPLFVKGHHAQAGLDDEELEDLAPFRGGAGYARGSAGASSTLGAGPQRVAPAAVASHGFKSSLTPVAEGTFSSPGSESDRWAGLLLAVLALLAARCMLQLQAGQLQNPSQA